MAVGHTGRDTEDEQAHDDVEARGSVAMSAQRQSLADKLDHLFETVRDSNHRKHSGAAVAAYVARHSGESCSREYVSRLRQGHATNPTKRVLEGLAAFFDVSPAFFFDDEQTDALRAQLELAVTVRGLGGVVSRLTFDANTCGHTEDGYDSRLVVHVELAHPDLWWVRRGGDGGPVFNAMTGTWDHDRAARTAETPEQRDAYFAGQAEAVRRARRALTGRLGVLS